ncbi:MAG: DUF1893 domain-containing protein [Clostridiales bacterium]|jgi:hypothetical protein|nr:DUF1893 domain-containing protein [Clostridiales bacterium]
MPQNLEKSKIGAVQAIKSGEATCVVVRNGQNIYVASGHGVSPLLKLYQTEPDKFQDSFVADKIIGKAAAAIIIMGGASEVYGDVMSIAAHEYLALHNVHATYGEIAEVIHNKNENGICPIERSVLDVKEPYKCLTQIIDTVKCLKACLSSIQ